MKPLSRSLLYRLLVLVILVMAGGAARAQYLTIAADRESILLGEQFSLDLKLTVPLGQRITKWPSLPDSFNHLEVVDRGAIDSIRQGDKMLYTQTLTMTGFDSGRWAIPPVVAAVGGSEVRSASASINVQNIKLEGAEYNDVKEIIEVEPLGPDWKRIGLFALGLVLILALAWYWWKNRGRKEKKVTVQDRGTAYDEAVKAMERLRKEGLLEKGEEKKYYSGLYDIYRSYLSAISGRRMVQYTTDDVLMHVKDELDKPVFAATAEALRVCDAVKFAKYRPGVEEGRQSMAQVMASIDAMNRKK